MSEKSCIPQYALLITLNIVSVVGLLQKDIVCGVIEHNGYTCEKHLVNTVDGYVLTLHRIPPTAESLSVFSKQQQRQQQQRHPFVLMHGLIGSSADFILPGRRRALAALLHEQGYDVWLPNARGTTHSKRHLKLDSSQPAFWNYSWHEMGAYDLPAIVDYVLNSTAQQRLHYVSHSQGSTTFFVMLSEHPEYNERIASAALLAPAAFLFNLISPPLRLLASKASPLWTVLDRLGLHELLPSSSIYQVGGSLFCGKGALTQNLCIKLIYVSVGFSDFPIDRQLLPRIFDSTPAGTSGKLLLHFGQLVNSGRFHKFDYGSEKENYLHYNRSTPPDYNLLNVRVPLQLFYGSKDFIVTKPDVIRLAQYLRNTHYTLNEIRGFNHIDLLYSREAPRLVYQQILSRTKRYYQRRSTTART